jgi:hypothetical protein
MPTAVPVDVLLGLPDSQFTPTAESNEPQSSPATGDGRAVTAWLGSVVSLPPGSQYDDYLSLLPEGAGEIGLTGVDEEIEAQIVALRDKEEPGKYAHF